MNNPLNTISKKPEIEQFQLFKNPQLHDQAPFRWDFPRWSATPWGHVPFRPQAHCSSARRCSSSKALWPSGWAAFYIPQGKPTFGCFFKGTDIHILHNTVYEFFNIQATATASWTLKPRTLTTPKSRHNVVASSCATERLRSLTVATHPTSQQKVPKWEAPLKKCKSWTTAWSERKQHTSQITKEILQVIFVFQKVPKENKRKKNKRNTMQTSPPSGPTLGASSPFRPEEVSIGTCGRNEPIGSLQSCDPSVTPSSNSLRFRLVRFGRCGGAWNQRNDWCHPVGPSGKDKAWKVGRLSPTPQKRLTKRTWVFQNYRHNPLRPKLPGLRGVTCGTRRRQTEMQSHHGRKLCTLRWSPWVRGRFFFLKKKGKLWDFGWFWWTFLVLGFGCLLAVLSWLCLLGFSW